MNRVNAQTQSKQQQTAYSVCSTTSQVDIRCINHDLVQAESQSEPSFSDTFSSIQTALAANAGFLKSGLHLAHAEMLLAKKAIFASLIWAPLSTLICLLVVVSFNFLAYQVLVTTGTSGVMSASIIFLLNILILGFSLFFLRKTVSNISMQNTVSTLFSKGNVEGEQ